MQATALPCKPYPMQHRLVSKNDMRLLGVFFVNRWLQPLWRHLAQID